MERNNNTKIGKTNFLRNFRLLVGKFPYQSFCLEFGRIRPPQTPAPPDRAIRENNRASGYSNSSAPGRGLRDFRFYPLRVSDSAIHQSPTEVIKL
jgi:hypothetical protein